MDHNELTEIICWLVFLSQREWSQRVTAARAAGPATISVCSEVALSSDKYPSAKLAAHPFAGYYPGHPDESPVRVQTCPCRYDAVDHEALIVAQAKSGGAAVLECSPGADKATHVVESNTAGDTFLANEP